MLTRDTEILLIQIFQYYRKYQREICEKLGPEFDSPISQPNNIVGELLCGYEHSMTENILGMEIVYSVVSIKYSLVVKMSLSIA